MPNVDTPKGGRYSGWFRDELNDRLELYVKGNFVTQFSSTGVGLGRGTTRLASTAAIASNGAGAILGPAFIAPASLKIK